MIKYDICPNFECQNSGFRMSKYDLECQITILALFRMSKKDVEYKNTIIGPSSNVKIGFRMSKYEIRPQFECQNRILNVKIRYSAQL